jgi:hypothetical protein
MKHYDLLMSGTRATLASESISEAKGTEPQLRPKEQVTAWLTIWADFELCQVEKGYLPCGITQSKAFRSDSTRPIDEVRLTKWSVVDATLRDWPGGYPLMLRSFLVWIYGRGGAPFQFRLPNGDLVNPRGALVSGHLNLRAKLHAAIQQRLDEEAAHKARLEALKVIRSRRRK